MLTEPIASQVLPHRGSRIQSSRSLSGDSVENTYLKGVMTYKFLIQILSVNVMRIAGHQFLDKLEIFSTKLISIVHKFYILLSHTVFYRWWHFHNS